MFKKLAYASAVFSGFVATAAVVHGASLLTGANGMTLYVFDKDAGGKPSCYATCATHWPPYMAMKDAKMQSGWTEVTRKDGKMQWAYDGKPVYFFAGDKKKGDKMGDGMGGMWHAVME